MNYRDDFIGTSASTPLVAGVAALVLSMDPTLTHEEARAVLTKTAKRIDYANADVDGQWRDVDGDGVKEYSSWYGFGMAWVEIVAMFVGEKALNMIYGTLPGVRISNTRLGNNRGT